MITTLARSLRQDMYDNIQTFSFANIDKFSTASIVTRLATDVTNVQNAYQMIHSYDGACSGDDGVCHDYHCRGFGRFYDTADGKIRYDGININKIKKADLRRSLGVVLQEGNLFTGTVMENIRCGNPDATDEQCVRAAKLANADGFIRMLPQGDQTVLEGDGSGLSQGQP